MKQPYAKPEIRTIGPVAPGKIYRTIYGDFIRLREPDPLDTGGPLERQWWADLLGDDGDPDTTAISPAELEEQIAVFTSAPSSMARQLGPWRVCGLYRNELHVLAVFQDRESAIACEMKFREAVQQ